MSGIDFSHTSIKGANISNGLLNATNFEGADLTDVTAKICFFENSNFENANLIGLNRGKFPDIRGHSMSISSVCFSPDGKLIVTGSYDKQAMIWDGIVGVRIGEPLKGHSDKINSVSYSPDGKQIVTGG